MQIIRVQWDKSARGGELATKRNAVPAAFAISGEYLQNSSGLSLIEEQMWDISNQFTAPIRQWISKPDLAREYKNGCLTVKFSSQSVQVLFDGESGKMGAPVRPFSRSFSLEADQWARLRWNGRFADFDSGMWWYEQVTVNIAHFNGAPDGRVFLDGAPTTEFDQLADLW